MALRDQYLIDNLQNTLFVIVRRVIAGDGFDVFRALAMAKPNPACCSISISLPLSPNATTS